MIKLLLGLSKAPTPHDAADALAVAICHLHSRRGRPRRAPAEPTGRPRTSHASPLLAPVPTARHG
jgi:hypothetical protein